MLKINVPQYPHKNRSCPLGNLIIGLLGVGVGYKSGFLNSLFKVIGEKLPRKVLTFLVVLLGVIF